MKASLIELQNTIKSLRLYIQGVEQEKKLLSISIENYPNSDVKAALEEFHNHYSIFRNKKILDYNTLIVSLYGCFENFIESITEGYIRYLNTIVPTFSGLPAKIQQNHVELSADLIKRLDHAKYQNVTNQEQIISHLHSCLYNKSGYKLNTEAYTYHTANFRYEIINLFLQQIGFEKATLQTLTKLNFSSYCQKVYPGIQLSSTSEKTFFRIIDDLALRRNDVAHGVSTSDILSNDILQDYIDCIEAFSLSLYDVFIESTLAYEAQFNCIPLKSAIKIINNKIICINLENTEISIGDTIIARVRTDRQYYSGVIEEIQVDRIQHSKLLAMPSIDVGIKVSFKAKENQDFYLLKK